MVGESGASADSYSFADRLLHRMAFAHPVIQRALSEIESDMFAARYAAQSAERPVFVTGLPRAGTTLLLEILYRTGEFSTFTYREMPLLLAPLLWSTITKSGRKAAQMKERAHGDGMQVSFDSPEAFEEVAWLSYLGDAYVGEETLKPLTADVLTPEFREAFPKLIRKLSASQAAGQSTKRYLSKNNANISRIGAIRSLFPDAAIFVCLRRPSTHVRSLMTQHARFLNLHRQDRFARDYMRWIGHFDFGANFRPIDFGGRGENATQAADADFWLRYWIDAYAHAARSADAGVRFVAFDEMLSDPEGRLRLIGEAAGLSDIEAFVSEAARLRAPTTDDAPLDGADPDLVAQAEAAYAILAKAGA